MKRIISILLVTLLTIALLCACDVISANIDFDEVNALTEVSYSGWNISTSTLYKEIMLESVFNITKGEEQTEISYSVEQLNELSIDATSEFKSVKEGSVIVKDGKILSSEGAELSQDIGTLENVGLNFKGKYFSTVTKAVSGKITTLTATVKDVQGFMGKDVDATSMKVDLTYSADGFNYIKLKYNTKDGANVTVEYTFVK